MLQNYLYVARSNGKRRASRLLFALSLIILSLHTVSLQVSPIFAQTAENLVTLAPQQKAESKLGEITLNILASSASLHTFEPFLLTLEIETPNCYDPSLDETSGEYGDFYLEPNNSTTEVKSDKYNKITKTWTIEPMRSGSLVLPPIPLYLTNKEDPNEVVALRSPLVKFTLTTSSNDASIEDVQGNWTPIRKTPISFIVCVAFVVILVISLILVLRRVLKKHNDVLDVRATIAEDPYEKVKKALRELKTSNIYLYNPKDFYLRLSDVLRTYLYERFDIPTRPKTSNEIIKEIFTKVETPKAPVRPGENDSFQIEPRQIKLLVLQTPELYKPLESIFSAVDLVKFARRSPSSDTTLSHLNETDAFVERAEKSLQEAMSKALDASAENESSTSVDNVQ